MEHYSSYRKQLRKEIKRKTLTKNNLERWIYKNVQKKYSTNRWDREKFKKFKKLYAKENEKIEVIVIFP